MIFITTLFVQLIDAPDILAEETSSDTIVKEGEDVMLTCKATGRPEPQIMWKREDGKTFIVKEGPVKKKGLSIGKKLKIKSFYYKIYIEKFNLIMVSLILVFLHRGEVLRLHKVRRRDMGAFMCIASNNVPPTVSRRVSLSVNCKYISLRLML